MSHPGPGAKMFVGEGRVPFQPGCSGSSRVAGRGHELKNVRASVGRQGPGRSLVTSEIACPRPVSDASVSKTRLSASPSLHPSAHVGTPRGGIQVTTRSCGEGQALGRRAARHLSLESSILLLHLRTPAQVSWENQRKKWSTTTKLEWMRSNDA